MDNTQHHTPDEGTTLRSAPGGEGTTLRSAPGGEGTTLRSAPGYETRDLSLRVVLLFGLVLGIMTVLVLFLMGTLFDYFAWQRTQSEHPPSPLAEIRPPMPPEPRLQVNPAQDLQKLRAREETLLHRYEWIDREAQIVRIPIDRAMDLLVERGLPSRPQK